MQGVQLPGPVLHWPHIHRQIPEPVLPWGGHSLHQRKPANPQTHYKVMYPLCKPSGKPTGQKLKDCPPRATRHLQWNCCPLHFPTKLGCIHVHWGKVHAQKRPVIQSWTRAPPHRLRGWRVQLRPVARTLCTCPQITPLSIISTLTSLSTSVHLPNPTLQTPSPYTTHFLFHTPIVEIESASFVYSCDQNK